MKKWKVTVVLVALGASMAMAQGPRGHHRGERGDHGDMMKQRMEHLDSIVDLTDDQKVKIESINKDYREKMKANRGSGDREAMKELRKKQKEEIESVLTEEQKTKLKAAHDAKKAEMKEMRSELKTYREQKITPTLKAKRLAFDQVLTEDEKATITKLRGEMKAQREEWKAGKTEKGDHKVNHEKRKEAHAKLAAALTPIVEAHKAELAQIDEDLKPLRDTWKADMDAIKAKHKKDCGKCVNKSGGKHKRAEGEKGEDMKYYRFLLMKTE